VDAHRAELLGQRLQAGQPRLARVTDVGAGKLVGQAFQAGIRQDRAHRLLVARRDDAGQGREVVHQQLQHDVDRLARGVGGLVAAAAGVALLGPAALGGAGLHVVGVHLGTKQASAVEHPHGDGSLAREDHPDPKAARCRLGEVLDRRARVAVGHVGRSAAPQRQLARGAGPVLPVDHEAAGGLGGGDDAVPRVESVDPLQESTRVHQDFPASAGRRTIRRQVLHRSSLTKVVCPMGVGAWWLARDAATIRPCLNTMY
jgi:hypothetical protein